MAKRILNRKDLRADFDAAERRKDDEEQEENEEEAETEEEEEQDGADDEAEEDEEKEEKEEEEVKPKKKKKVVAEKPVKAKAKPRSRTAKVTRLRLVWGVFNNSNQCVATYEYPRRKEAEEHAARLSADKRSTHFVQPVKEPIEEKKEK